MKTIVGPYLSPLQIDLPMTEGLSLFVMNSHENAFLVTWMRLSLGESSHSEAIMTQVFRVLTPLISPQMPETISKRIAIF